MDPLDETALAAREGDPVAVAALIRATQAQVLRMCGAMAGPQEAEDLAQETYVRALASLSSWQGTAPVRVWLLGVARHTCHDALRRASRRRRLVERLTTVRQAHAEPSSDRVIAGLTLAGLDPDRRAAFVLTQLVGLSYDEAALACEVPVGTIRSRVSRAREQLLAEHRQAQGA